MIRFQFDSDFRYKNSMRTVKDILILVDVMFAGDWSWIQGAYCRTWYGKNKSILSDDVSQWCLTGAIAEVCGIDLDAFADTCRVMKKYLWDFHAAKNIEEFNDCSTFDEVKAALQSLINTL
jgi:hypothetical protein